MQGRKTYHSFSAFLIAVVIFCCWIATAHTQKVSSATAQTTQAANQIELHQALLDLTNPWTVMCIAAHPDDEDGTSLTVMRRKFGAYTVSLFSTFGEGGQNAIGPELYEELGAIRVRETIAAAEIQGSEPYFLGLKDFGFSKSADEAFRFWGHDEALRRMVLQIRKLRPDVIITNHSATNNDHGHHQATARLELEAFDAAADPKRFPEQLGDDVTVWQVQRLFVRAGRSNQPPTDSAQLVTIDPNEPDPVRGKTFAEEALEALQKHATQGPWPRSVAQLAARFTGSTDGRLPLVRYRLTREAKGADALPKDSHNFLDGLRLPEKVAERLAPATVDGKALTEFGDQRRQLVDALIGIRKAGKFRPLENADPRRFARMDRRLDAAFAAATNISAKTTARDQVVIPGLHTTFTVTIANNGNIPATVYSYTFVAGGRDIKTLYTGSSAFPPGDTGSVTDDWTIPADTEPSLPHSQHLYDGRVFGDEFSEVVKINLADIKFSVTGSTRVDVASAVEIANLSPTPIVRTPAQVIRSPKGTEERDYSAFDFTVRVTNNQNATFTGDLVVDQGFGRNGVLHRITIPAHDKIERTLKIPGYPQSTGLRKNEQRQPGPVTFTVAAKGAATPLARLDVPVVWADARVAPNLRVGYVRGFDCSLPHALAALGVESKELTVEEVKTADLRKYTTIIVDNRVYESQPELVAANQKLLDYVKEGGTLVVFYHKSNEWNPDERRKRPQLAPYKLILGDERVTDETAAITFIEPDHPLLNVPNKIGQSDFANWIQERGLYYPRDWDPQFHALLETNDPGEAPLKGGLLVADYGRGHYIYTSMVWYRELRAGLPGAYRVFANMISYK
jgi:LmbE family N-acetylglucosaminyl deacetylase